MTFDIPADVIDAAAHILWVDRYENKRGIWADQTGPIVEEFRAVARAMIQAAWAGTSLVWRPIEELTREAKYGDPSGFLLLAPELVDLECNEHGVGMGYWDGAGWSAVPKWSMHNDEWREVRCTPTHYIRLTGVQNAA